MTDSDVVKIRELYRTFSYRWTSSFENALTILLDGVRRRARTQDIEALLLEWIEKNPGRDETQSTIGRETGLSRESVQKKMRQLEAKGVIRSVGEPQRPRAYERVTPPG